MFWNVTQCETIMRASTESALKEVALLPGGACTMDRQERDDYTPLALQS